MSKGGNSKKYDLESCVNRFISDKSVEGLSKATLKGYRYHLNYLMTYTNKNVNEFTKEDIKQFLTDRENNSNFSSKSTIQTVRSVLKSFFGWLVQEQLIDVNPVNRVKPFKRQEAYIEALSDTDLSKIKSACISLREKALIEVLCSTGCTLNEIPNLEKSRINWEENELVIRSNSRGNRSVFLTAQAIIFIKEYLESRTDDCKELFVTERRPYKKIGDRSIQKQIAQIIERTDLNKKISARTFRHTFAQSMLKKGCPVNVIQALLGSKDFATTAVTYFRLTSENKKQIYNNYY